MAESVFAGDVSVLASVPTLLFEAGVGGVHVKGNESRRVYLRWERGHGLPTDADNLSISCCWICRAEKLHVRITRRAIWKSVAEVVPAGMVIRVGMEIMDE